MSDRLTEEQRNVVNAVLSEETAAREHLVVHLSGGHAYGFSSVDSDVDLKAIHIAPTAELLGLGKPRSAASRAEVIDGVEIDYTSNELSTALRGALNGDGNMLERVMSQEPLHEGNELGALVALCRANLTTRFYNHYKGFATSQRRACEVEPQRSVKKVLYVLRTTLTGAHLLETGECVPDLSALAPRYGLHEVEELIMLKRSAESGALPPRLEATIPALFDQAFGLLEASRERSTLPEQPRAIPELERWLLEVRRKRL